MIRGWTSNAMALVLATAKAVATSLNGAHFIGIYVRLIDIGWFAAQYPSAAGILSVYSMQASSAPAPVSGTREARFGRAILTCRIAS